MTTEEPLVAVFTPVYNGGKYLSQCIESVLGQTYQNWVYIILDNASTDDTLSIAQEYERRDHRIQVLHYDTLVGVIDNHNRAFKLISPHARDTLSIARYAKYCKVVSADDWMLPECLTRMVDVAERHPSVGVVGCYQLSGGGPDWHNWKIIWQNIPYPSEFVTGREISRLHHLDSAHISVFGSPTSLLYRADLVRAHDKFYPNQSAEADTSAVCRCLQTSDYGFVHQVLCYERTNNDGRVTATSKKLNAYLSSGMSDIQAYGSTYLTAQEREDRLKALLKEYYYFLSICKLRGRDQKFWTYHDERLLELGYPLDHARLYAAVLARIGELLINPMMALKVLKKQAG